MESLEPVKVYNAFTSTYISDHRLVGIELQMKKQLEKIDSSKTRNYKEFSPETFEETINDSSILGHEDFHTAVAE